MTAPTRLLLCAAALLALAVEAKPPAAAKGPVVLEGSFTPGCSASDEAAMLLKVPLPEERGLDLTLWGAGLKALAPKGALTIKERAVKDGSAMVCDLRSGTCNNVGGTLTVSEYSTEKELSGRFEYVERGVKRTATFRLAFQPLKGTGCGGKRGKD